VQGADIRLPSQMQLLLQLAGEDEIVSSDAAHQLFERLHLETKNEIMYPGLYHEIYNEPTKEKVFQDWIDWMSVAKILPNG
jgi:lysophospholipase